MWATENIKNRNGEDLYFAWGETSGNTAENIRNEIGKWKFTWDDYEFGSDGAFTKYNSTDRKTVLDSENDAASVNWSNGWRMPTMEEFDELFSNDNTRKEWLLFDGVYHIMLTSLHNGNKLYFPTKGYVTDGRRNGYGSIGAYWAVSLCDGFDYQIGSKFDLFYDDTPLASCGYRCEGYSIRPVRSPNI